MNKIIALLAAGLAAVTLGLAAPAQAGTPHAGRWAFSVRLTTGQWLPGCPTEDSRGCVWDAALRGNGIGRAFIAPHKGHLIFLRVTSERFLVATPGTADTTGGTRREVHGTVHHRAHRYRVVAQLIDGRF